MPTTSNFGWTTPADTDLVKDGASAIRTLGNGIDTSLVDLKGGTTGQILSKNSNTDLDYTWVTPNVGDITEVQAGTGISVASGTGPIPVVTNTVATTFDAKADLVVGTGADTFAKLTVGANGTVLTADSTETTGLKWAAAGSLTQLATGSLSSTSTSITSISGSYTNLLLVIYEMSANANGGFTLRFNSDSGNNYYSVQTDSVTANRNNNAATSINIQTEGNLGTNTSATNVLKIYNYSSSSIRKLFDGVWFGYRNTGSLRAGNLSGAWDSTSAITSIQIIAESPNTFDNGSYILYGVL